MSLTETQVIGIDTNSYGYHVVRRDNIYSSFQAKKSQDADSRRMQACVHFDLFLQTVPEGAHLFVEEPLALQNGKTTRILGLLAGALFGTFVMKGRDINWHWVDVSSWKKHVVGNGNASKDLVRMFVSTSPPASHLPLDDWDAEPDYYDAYCLKLYGMRELAS